MASSGDNYRLGILRIYAYPAYGGEGTMCGRLQTKKTFGPPLPFLGQDSLGALVSWAGLTPTLRLMGFLGSTHFDPTNKVWAPWAAARAAPFPSRAGCDRTDGTRLTWTFPPPGVVPQAAGRRSYVVENFRDSRLVAEA